MHRVVLCVTAFYLMAVTVLLGLGVAAAAGSQSCGSSATQAGTVGSQAGMPGPRRDGGLDLSATQWAHASTVVAVGQAMRVPSRGIVIALAVALQESGLRNYANDGRGSDLAPDQRGVASSLSWPNDAVGTDHGSVGVFQQQWPWWGSLRQLMTPATSAGLFFAALTRVPGWAQLPLTVAAQRVQRSATPTAYSDDGPRAAALYGAISGRAATDSTGVPVGRALTVTACDPRPASGQLVHPSKTGWPLPARWAGTDRHNWGGRGAHWSSWHTGTDFSVPCGTPVLAASSGTARIDSSQAWAGPHLLMISAGPGQLTTWYAHMRRVLVRPGQHVETGQQVGEVGAEGNATGCHLHFEVHTRGGSIYGADNVNPSTWLGDHIAR